MKYLNPIIHVKPLTDWYDNTSGQFVTPLLEGLKPEMLVRFARQIGKSGMWIHWAIDRAHRIHYLNRFNFNL